MGSETTIPLSESMTVVATVYLGRGKREQGKEEGLRGVELDGKGVLIGLPSLGCVFACRERSQEGTGVTRCEGKALSSAPGP